MMRTLMSVALMCSLALIAAAAEDDDKGKEDTPKAAKTRKLLKTKVTVEFKDERLRDAMDELQESVKGLKILLDTKGGVSQNQKITYKAKDKPLDQVLDEMFKGPELGYFIISQKGETYDGLMKVVKGNARGYEKKKKE